MSTQHKCNVCGSSFTRIQRSFVYYCSKTCQKAAKAERGRLAALQRWRSLSKEERQIEARRGHLKRTFNLTPEEYEGILMRQGGGCGICGKDKGAKTYFSVDHDHATGFVRGLLCHRCNMGLGSFRDDPKALKRAISYLGKSYGNQYLRLVENAA